MAYPGYTIRLIEDGLSRRQIEVMMAAWEEHPPTFVSMRRLQVMFGKAHGFKTRKSGDRLSGQAMLDSLMSRGYLS